MTHPNPLNDLRDEAAYKAATHPELVEQYRAYWLELTARPRPPHVDIEAARAAMLAMLVNETPIETAKEVLRR